MVRKGYHSIVIIVMILLFFNNKIGLNACVNPKSCIQDDSPENNIPLDLIGMEEIHGEVTAISATQVSIDTGTSKNDLRLSPQAQIFCNGLPSVWFALKPVAPEAFFEAKALVNRHHEVVYIAGEYRGEICVLQSWRVEQEKLYLQLFAVDSSRTYWRMVSPRAKMPESNWLAGEIEIYVLYNHQQDIRAVFLPN
jgi:hypothetical protein